MGADRKKCSACKLVKECADFNRNRRTADGYQNNCRSCQSFYNRQHYLGVRDAAESNRGQDGGSTGHV